MLDVSKIIKNQPRLLCECCFKEHCKGHGLTKIIKLLKRLFLIMCTLCKTPKNNFDVIIAIVIMIIVFGFITAIKFLSHG